jgi:hypothetical protein
VTRATLLALVAAPLVPPLRVERGGCAPTFVAPVRAPEAPPELVAIWLSQPDYGWGDLAHIRVVASTNVALVELRVGPYGRALTKRAPGQFSGVSVLATVRAPALYADVSFRRAHGDGDGDGARTPGRAALSASGAPGA